MNPEYTLSIPQPKSSTLPASTQLQAPSPGTRLVGVDLIRLLAALLVAGYHLGFGRLVGRDTPVGDAFVPASVPAIDWLTHSGWVGVELFFVISGFVIAQSAQDASTWRFVRSRILRLVPGVWICAPLTVLVFHFALGQSLGPLMAKLANTVLFVPLSEAVEDVYWTLGVEVSFYALVAVLVARNSFHPPAKIAGWLVFTSSIFWVITLLYPYLTDLKSYSHREAEQIISGLVTFRPFQILLLQHGCFFALGMLLHQMNYGQFSLKLTGLAVFSVVLCWFEICNQNRVVSYTYQQTLSAYPALLTWSAGMILLVWSIKADTAFSALGQRMKQAIRLIGLATFPLYLIHKPVGLAVSTLLFHQGFGLWPMVSASILVSFVLALAIAAFAEPLVRLAMAKVVDAGITALASRPGLLKT